MMSCEAGTRKPEEIFYRQALKQLELPADQVAYLDDLPEYVTAAARLGIRAIQHDGDFEATRQAVMNLIKR